MTLCSFCLSCKIERYTVRRWCWEHKTVSTHQGSWVTQTCIVTCSFFLFLRCWELKN